MTVSQNPNQKQTNKQNPNNEALSCTFPPNTELEKETFRAGFNFLNIDPCWYLRLLKYPKDLHLTDTRFAGELL